jgi:acetate kinase
MKILALNCGSSTAKFELLEVGSPPVHRSRSKTLLAGAVERIGPDASLAFRNSALNEREAVPVKDHHDAVAKIIAVLQSRNLGSFDAVGHRVVHGGDRFSSSVLIDNTLLEDLESLCELAPLHNPASVGGIRAARALLGSDLPMVAVFDTAFHKTLPEVAAVYGIPHDLSAKHHIRRFGFHGIAHQYSMLRYGELAGVAPEQTTIVTLHLGNGCSACAIRDGKSVDTSMGFTPLEGLLMGTRSGDLDPALVAYLGKAESLDFTELEELLNKRSGLLGITGLSSDMRELASAYDTNPRARLGVDVFCYRARKYLGAYLAALAGARAIVFSGGIGEHSPLVRQKICAKMEWCGLYLDERANAAVTGLDARISPENSQIHVFVVHTDEELIIAQETARLVSSAGH